MKIRQTIQKITDSRLSSRYKWRQIRFHCILLLDVYKKSAPFKRDVRWGGSRLGCCVVAMCRDQDSRLPPTLNVRYSDDLRCWLASPMLAWNSGIFFERGNPPWITTFTSAGVCGKSAMNSRAGSQGYTATDGGSQTYCAFCSLSVFCLWHWLPQL